MHEQVTLKMTDERFVLRRHRNGGVLINKNYYHLSQAYREHFGIKGKRINEIIRRKTRFSCYIHD